MTKHRDILHGVITETTPNELLYVSIMLTYPEFPIKISRLNRQEKFLSELLFLRDKIFKACSQFVEWEQELK